MHVSHYCLRDCPEAPGINYHPQSGWFEDAPLKGGAVLGLPPQGARWEEALFRGHGDGLPPQGARWQEALSEGTVVGGPHRGLRDCLDPPHGCAFLPSAVQNPPTPVARRQGQS